MLFEPLELIERLAVLVPPPRFHMVRYHGILAPAASWRDAVVPLIAAPDDGGTGISAVGAASRERRLSWSKLLSRVFAVDALTCPRCGQSMRILAAIHSLEAARAILECLELPSRAPPVAPPALNMLGAAET